uniref:WGS project CBMI000000000 data, contig CS3069_c001690 n=1 Tax=Fusarium clavum TaxID=2594811 RepID=A0A090MG46_9HYPO|nr:unnamed protein product [Fusarium clavum]
MCEITKFECNSPICESPYRVHIIYCDDAKNDRRNMIPAGLVERETTVDQFDSERRPHGCWEQMFIQDDRGRVV